MGDGGDPVVVWFGRLVELKGEARSEALAQVKGLSGLEQRRLVRLLEAHDRTGGVIDRGVDHFFGAGGDAVDPELIGDYRLVSRLGEGGFGVVYLAEQSAPIRRTVALKVIKAGMDSSRVITRFEAERQALALMDHPGIARVFDAGTTDAALGLRPFFVMEYVPGEPITLLADRLGMSTRERLGLFLQVCGAIQHAHMKGVIHRDIKPSNVLAWVPQGGAPAVKVIDFGVAKALHQKLSEETVATLGGQVVGTPEYMSPEQAGGGLQAVDTRSDVYSLGVLLYELLAGARPFDLGGLALAELARKIREDEPARPSVRAAEAGVAGALCRGTTMASLRRELARELEWIPLRAMRKSARDRYQSAAELAADVENYLAGRALVAGPPTTAYRVGKFVSRHRASVAAGAVGLVAIGVGAAGLWAGRADALRAEAAQRRTAEENARLAESEAARAEEAIRQRDTAAAFRGFILGDVFGVVAPAIANGREVTVREALGGASDRLLELESWTGTQAMLASEMGRLHTEIGQTGPAAVLLERALPRLREVFGEETTEYGRGLFNRAVLHAIVSEWGDSLRLMDRALALLEGDAEELVVLRAEGMRVSAFGAYHTLGVEAGLQRTARAVEAYGRIRESHPAEYAMSLGGHAQLLWMAGRLDDAAQYLPEATEVFERPDLRDHPLHAGVLAVRGQFELSGRGDPRVALGFMERAWEINQRAFGSGHPGLIPELDAIASTYAALGDRENQLRFLGMAAQIALDNPSIEPTQRAVTLLDFAVPLMEDGRFAESEPLARRALELLDGQPGWMRVPAAVTLARSLRGLGRWAEAEVVYLDAHSQAGEDGAQSRASIEAALERLYSMWDEDEPGAGTAARHAATLRGILRSDEHGGR